MEQHMKAAAFVVCAYMLGCINGAYYYGMIFKKKDIRDFGSGNPGALNTGMVLGKKAFFIVLAVDMLKGILVVLLARYFGLSSVAIIISIMAVVIGHIFPAQLRFKGGKGVAAFLGAILAYDPTLAALTAAIFAQAFLALRRFTVSGMVSIALVPALMAFFGYGALEIALMFMTVCLILFKNRDNIGSYLNERRASKKD